MSSDKKSDEDQKYGNRSLWIFVLILFVIVILVVSALIVIVVKYDEEVKHCEHEEESQNKVCSSPECITAAGKILSKMDLSANPCEDFYQYACGRYAESTQIPPEKPGFDPVSEVSYDNTVLTKKIIETPGTDQFGKPSTAIQKAKDYYKSCMNQAAADELGVEPLLELIDSLGSWTVTNTSHPWSKEDWDWQTVFMKAAKMGIHITPFVLGLSADFHNTSVNIFMIDQGGLTLPDRNYYLGELGEFVKDVFLRAFTGIGVLLGGDVANVQAIGEKVWSLEKSIATIHVPNEDRLDFRKLYHKTTLAEVDALLGDMIDLQTTLSDLYGVAIPPDENIVVLSLPFVKDISKVIENTDEETLANYGMWKTAFSLCSYLTRDFDEVLGQMSSAFYGTNSLPPRWETCVSRVDGNFPLVTSGLFAQKKFSKNAKKDIEDMLASIISAFENHVPDLTWMDEETKQRALNKARMVSHRIGFPDIAMDQEKLDMEYESAEITTDETFQNELNILKVGAEKEAEKYGRPVDHSSWAGSAMPANAYYDLTQNQMVFPAGILQVPFYNPHSLRVSNYGAIGSVIGHELLHGFDSSGRLFDKYGNLHNWWTSQSESSFEEKAQCMVDQYNKYPVQDTHLNGLLTLNENIADNGGLRMTLSAYQAWNKSRDSHPSLVTLPGLNMTDEQLLFLSFGQVWCQYATPELEKELVRIDVHSLNKYRVIGPLSNNEEFAKAFNCPLGSPMNPEKKCVVW